MTRLSRLTLFFTAMLLTSAASPRPQTADRLPPQALASVRCVAIQHNGRHKPFDSFAREILRQMTGAPRLGHADPVATVLSLVAEPERWHDTPLIAIPFIPLRQQLGMDRPQAAPVGTPVARPASGGAPGLGRKATHASYNELVSTRILMQQLPPIVGKQQRDEKLSILENETMDAFQRFVALSDLLEQKLELVPPPAGSTEATWRPILQPQGYPSTQQQALRASWSHFLEAVRGGAPDAVEAAAGQLAQRLREANPSAYPASWRLRLEVAYNQVRPFRLARLCYVIGVLGFLISLLRNTRRAAAVGWGGLIGGYVLHGAAIAVRMVLGGRPPVSNFFESMLWLPFAAVTVGLIFERLYRMRYVGLATALLAVIALLIADAVPLDSSISPVVAVLRSNLWLTVHVLTIVASYGALALAAVIAHLYGILYLSRGGKHAALGALDLLLYRTIQIGVVLLAAGIMLGAVWANASWGRYWGWDPKETWALITLLWFLAILHGRFAGWLRGVGTALSTIAGFFLLLMTYYGVSFYLVGLHSYAGGHAKPLPPLLIAYLIAELAFLTLLGAVAFSRRRLTSP